MKMSTAVRGMIDQLERAPLPLSTTVYMFGIGALGSIAILVLVGAGQAIALGPSVAYQLYFHKYPKGVLIGAAFCAALGAFIGTIPFFAEQVRRLKSRSPTAARIGKWVFRMAVASYGLGIFVWLAYSGAQRDYPDLVGRDPGRDGLQTVVERQSSSLARATANTASLLRELDATEADVKTAKEQLRATLAAFEKQQQALNSSTATIKELDDRQTTLRVQIAAIEQALGGQQPITRGDFEQSGRMALVQGFFLGIVTSLLATYLYERGKRWGRRSPSQHAGPPPGDYPGDY